MRLFQSTWFPVGLGIAFTALIMFSLLHQGRSKIVPVASHDHYRENEEWSPPSEEEIGADAQGDLIRYGKELILHTGRYLGPRGTVAAISNGMNCGNCHIEAGTQNF